MLKTNPYMKAYLNVINEDTNNTNIIKYQSIAKEIGGEYISETNTIDCKRNRVYFNNEWLDENGSFNFKLINTFNDWSFMFNYCDKLTHLPKDFIIPNGVTNCSNMFCHCESLTHLPDNFTIPGSVTNCECMFDGCVLLTHLPDSFTIPNNVKNCEFMFVNCESLTYLPDNFHIPVDVDSTEIFTGCTKLEYTDPKAYMMWEI